MPAVLSIGLVRLVDIVLLSGFLSDFRPDIRSAKSGIRAVTGNHNGCNYPVHGIDKSIILHTSQKHLKQ